jgi:hypothetical protein
MIENYEYLIVLKEINQGVFIGVQRAQRSLNFVPFNPQKVP